MFSTLTHEAPAARTTDLRIPSLLARLAAAVAREIRIHRDMRILGSLDENALHDIGLARGGVEDAVRHGRQPGYGLTMLNPSSAASANMMMVPPSYTEWR